MLCNRFFREHEENSVDNGLKIWSLLMIEVWQRMYFDKQSEESVLESAMGNSKLPTGFVGDGFRGKELKQLAFNRSSASGMTAFTQYAKHYGPAQRKSFCGWRRWCCSTVYAGYPLLLALIDSLSETAS